MKEAQRFAWALFDVYLDGTDLEGLSSFPNDGPYHREILQNGEPSGFSPPYL